jgi:2-polyprenyl-3-methyl-5-hydroxy-6-metoxy-1,4-benzoquinol methylase
MMAMSSTKSSFKSAVGKIPVLGDLLRIGKVVLKLPASLGSIEKSLAVINQQLTSNSKQLTALDGSVEAHSHATTKYEERLRLLDDRLNEVTHQIMVTNDAKATPTGSSRAPSKELFADDHALDHFYVEFENRFRGPEDEIKRRLKVYVPILKKLDVDFALHPVLDIGAGRGELLDLLQSENINALGLDINKTMVQRANDKGLKAVEGDALAYLASQPANSFGAITGFHIIEHIPFADLLRIIAECYRTLTPGGLVIFETPNPENLNVGAHTFFMDPSHLKPIPPEMMKFVLENRGFSDSQILRLHPAREDIEASSPLLGDVAQALYGPQDYSVLGTK